MAGQKILFVKTEVHVLLMDCFTIMSVLKINSQNGGVKLKEFPALSRKLYSDIVDSIEA